MIDLYTWTTPNGRKVSILLEEMGLAYTAHPIDITRGDQHDPAFLKISPNNKIPALRVRETGFTLFESGAILLWLATTHRRFIPEGDEYWRCVEWLMWQMGGLGPMLGQAHHFVHFNPDASDYARRRYGEEARRLYGVLDRRLAGRDYIAGTGRGEYTIADIACWPWVSRFEWQGIDLGEYPAVRDWYCRIAERPAVQRGYHVPKKVGEIPMP